MLGRYFWIGLQQGMSAGQALQWAKLSFANDMLNRQGYLDAEDQKTLLSFNLLGDPTLSSSATATSWEEISSAALLAKAPMWSCRNGGCSPQPAEVSPELVGTVQAFVAKALPWLASHEIRAARQVVCTGRCNGDGSHGNATPHGPAPKVERTVFTVAGLAGGPNEKHLHQVVKLTVDARGSIVKMAVSR
jgi:hypothetical protein